MKYLLIHTLMLLLLQKYVMSEVPCGERNLTGALGGAVTLQINHTGVPVITWSFSKTGAPIATTTPGGPPGILEEQFKGRLSSTSDRSLTITELRLEDQGTYQARYVTNGLKICFYHLTVFNNITAENITISHKVNHNKTCEANLTCSVNESNVNITWMTKNNNYITGTQNVVFVPPNNINLTYTCTAKNPVSEASKDVHPWEYCRNEKKDSAEDNTRIYIGSAASFLLVLIVIVIYCVCISHRKKKQFENVNEEKAALKQVANTYEMNDEDCTGNNETLVDEEQKLEEGRKKNNVKGNQESKMCSVNTVYSQIQLSQNAGSEAPNVNQLTPIREKGTAGMSKDPQAMELQESNDTNGNTVYSRVQHVKKKNNQTKQPSPSKENPSKAPLKPTRQVLESPMDKNKQKSPSERPNGNCSNPPLESCYAEVQLLQEKMAPLESCYSKVHVPQSAEM